MMKFVLIKVYVAVVVDMTNPVAGWVKDGKDPPHDMLFSARPATLWLYWGDFFDPESGIVAYSVTVFVNGEVSYKHIPFGQKDIVTTVIAYPYELCILGKENHGEERV